MKKAIELKKVSKFFTLANNKKISAIDNMTLSVEEGECLGIIGPNGSGKSTLLRLIAGIYHPDTGTIDKKGKTLPFLQFGSGLKQDLTGKENIYLYGALIGMTRIEIDNNFDKIVDFSGLRNFIDVKLKKYSSGMIARLIFSTAMARNPRIILIDEILSVGDQEFQRESLNKIKLLKKEGKTILFVSHNLFLIREISDNVICLKNGKIISQGSANDVIRDYLSLIKKTKLEKSKENLESKYRAYDTLKKEIRKLETYQKKKSLLSGFLNNPHEITLNELNQKKKILESDLIEHVDLQLLDSEYIVEDLWEDYNLGRNDPSLDQIKNIEKAINIKTQLCELSESEFEIQSGLFFYLMYNSKKSMEYTRKFIGIYKKKLRNIKGKKEKKWILDKLYYLFMDLNFEILSNQSYEYLIKEYLKLLSKNQTKESNMRIENIKNYHENQLNKLIYDIKLKISQNKRKQENKKRLERFKNLKKSLSYLSIGVETPLKKNKNKKIIIKKVYLLDDDNKERNSFYTGETLKIKIEYEAKEKIENPVFGIGIFHEEGAHVSGPNTKIHNIEIPYIKDSGSITYIMEDIPLLQGRYLISVVIHPNNSFEPYDIHEKKYLLEIKTKKSAEIGIVHLNSKWQIGEK